MSFSRSEYRDTTEAGDVAQFLHDEIAGKTVLITGVSPSTIGSEFTLTLSAHAPKLVIIATRSQKNLDEVTADIASKYPEVPVKSVLLDLASLESARKAGDEIASWEDVPIIDVLVNNAGIMAVPYKKTVDGFESQFAINHLGHFVFTKRVMPKILAAARAGREPRIVNISSSGHNVHGINWDDINFSDGETYDMWNAYGQSKTANILFSVELAERYRDAGVSSFSVHPGSVLGTHLGTHIPMEDIMGFLNSGRAPEPGLSQVFKTLSQGASTHVVAAFDPEIKEHSGNYFVDCAVSPEARRKDWALDKDNAKRLWELSEQLVGEKFDA
ncbi:hypothetical protein DRE_05243 [Drechslerella stenobrocha 248]|uniref:Uncharacterized protein n=1 Tax=Drechslerella stenobrocha 248 TaxID=1043628 RepID=W7HZN6_9PEZI|nr:hypothetical protein DRE_05243 [Drechslerella stenobrocha 248]